MTIDERLERLTERHEALTQSVEILRVTVEEQKKEIELLLATAKQDGENIRALARIADTHDRRLTKLEKSELQ